MTLKITISKVFVALFDVKYCCATTQLSPCVGANEDELSCKVNVVGGPEAMTASPAKQNKCVMWFSIVMVCSNFLNCSCRRAVRFDGNACRRWEPLPDKTW